MLQLTEDQKVFLKRYQIPLSAIFDASGLSKNEYHELMKNLDKFYAIGVTPCKAGNHTLRTRNGHCLQCNPAAITYLNRYYNNSIVYVASSLKNRKTKVGYTKDINERENALNATVYAGISDWKIIYFVNCKNAGKIESEIQGRLSNYYYPSEYKLGGRQVACYEVFTCGYNRVKKVISEVKKEFANEFIGKDVELEDAENLFDFGDVNVSNSLRKGGIGSEIGHKPLGGKKSSLVRRSEFIDELNQIKAPIVLEKHDVEKVIIEHRDTVAVSNNSSFDQIKSEDGNNITKVILPPVTAIHEEPLNTKTEKKKRYNYLVVLFWVVLSLVILYFLFKKY